MAKWIVSKVHFTNTQVSRTHTVRAERKMCSRRVVKRGVIRVVFTRMALAIYCIRKMERRPNLIKYIEFQFEKTVCRETSPQNLLICHFLSLIYLFFRQKLHEEKYETKNGAISRLDSITWYLRLHNTGARMYWIIANRWIKLLLFKLGAAQQITHTHIRAIDWFRG